MNLTCGRMGFMKGYCIIVSCPPLTKKGEADRNFHHYCFSILYVQFITSRVIL